MKRPSREEYERAVALAQAAIRESKAAPRIAADRSPQALVAAMQEKQARGDAPTEADLGALAAALAEQESRKQRGRGRPKGTSDRAARRAFNAAAIALDGCGLHAFRNNATGHRLTQCDAIAEAMHAEGFRVLTTYDAAARGMRALRRNLRSVLAAVGPRVQEMLKPLRRQMQDIRRGINEALRPFACQMQEAGRTFSALAKHISAATTLSPETRREIERQMKTRR